MSSLFILFLFWATYTQVLVSLWPANKIITKQLVKSKVRLTGFFISIIIFLNNIVYVIQNVSMFLKTHSHDPYSSFSSGLSLHMQ